MTEALLPPNDGSQLAQSFDDFLDPLERPEDVFARNDQRRRDADDVFVSFFAEDPKLLQCLAVGSRRDIQFNPDPQAFAADLAYVRTLQRLQLGEEVVAEF